MMKIINWFKSKIEDYKRKKRIKAKIKELQKRDPFIYKHYCTHYIPLVVHLLHHILLMVV